MLSLTLRKTTLVFCETVLILVAVAIAEYIRLQEWAWYNVVHENGFQKTLIVAGVTQACLYYADLYDLSRVPDRRELFIRLMQALAAAAFILAGVYFWFPGLIIGRGVFAISAAIAICFIVGWRFAFEWLSIKVGPRERLLLIGTSPGALTLAKELYDRRNEIGVEIVGFVDSDPSRIGTPIFNPGIVGTIEDIPTVVRERHVDRVVVSLADARGRLPMEQLLEMKLDGVSFDHLASVYEEYTGKIALENLRPSWLIFSEGFRKSRALAAVKRVIDIVIASVGLVVGMPVFGLLAVAVKLTSAGPVLYHQRRVGLHGRVFTVHKLRTMRQDAEAATGPVWASKHGDPRVTPIGQILRRTRLDEVPQLWNVLKGEMSFVGPRPERPEFVSELTQQIPYYRQRHIVRPGLTGWAQVRYTYGASTEDALQKLQYDLYYIKNLSITLDMVIVFETIKTVVLRRGA